jgi:PAS domain S-box-containing protein
LSEERYRALFEHASDGIAVVKAADRQIIEVNNEFCKILGYRPQELIEKSIADLVSANGDGSGRDTLARMMDEGVSGEVELRMRTASGASMPASLSFNTLLKDRENLVVLIMRDLSERKRIEAEREQMQQQLAHNEKISALGRAAAQVAHEVKNPLAGLRLYSMHLRTKVADTASASEKELVEKIIHTVGYLSDTVDRVLDFARPITLTRAPVNINGLVADTLQMLEDQMKANKIDHKLELEDERGPLVCLVDEASIRSALMNLLVNAIQAMPSGGVLRVKTASNGKTVHLSITDTGAGIPEESLKRIFEPFYSTKNHGLGLGMPYAKKVIEQQQGAINVSSRLGEGTLVELELPAGK